MRAQKVSCKCKKRTGESKQRKESKILSWAELECRIACKKENPEYDFDSRKFDYGCSCYKSALRAYKSLEKDGHSGFSWSATVRILTRLLNHQPLTPITDEDFFSQGVSRVFESPEYLKEHNLKSNIQCPRYSALFRKETLDGKVSYHDVDRSYFIDIEDPSNTWSGCDSFIDEMFPITMPYMPSQKKFKIYAQEFLCDRSNGDFDTRGILYVETPEGERVDLNIFEAESEDHTWKTITREEYEDRLNNRRIDKIHKKVASDLLWTLISNSSSDSEIANREKLWESISEERKNSIRGDLEKLCMFFDNPNNFKYNNFHMRQSLCRQETEEYKDIPGLVDIADFLQEVLKEIKTDK